MTTADLLRVLQAADAAMRAAAEPLRGLGHAIDDVSIHQASPEAIAAAAAIPGADSCPSRISSTPKWFVYDVITVPLGNGRTAVLYGQDRPE